MVVFVVFFFKQKTAYEMRISDWSSDVCSSDLRANAHRGKVRASKAVIDRLKAKGLISPTLEKGLAPRTNLDRVLQMPYMAQALGIRIAKDGDISYENDDAAKGDKLLLKIVRAISDRKSTRMNSSH